MASRPILAGTERNAIRAVVRAPPPGRSERGRGLAETAGNIRQLSRDARVSGVLEDVRMTKSLPLLKMRTEKEGGEEEDDGPFSCAGSSIVAGVTQFL